jgi:hypothetical protein
MCYPYSEYYWSVSTELDGANLASWIEKTSIHLCTNQTKIVVTKEYSHYQQNPPQDEEKEFVFESAITNLDPNHATHLIAAKAFTDYFLRKSQYLLISCNPVQASGWDSEPAYLIYRCPEDYTGSE